MNFNKIVLYTYKQLIFSVRDLLPPKAKEIKKKKIP